MRLIFYVIFIIFIKLNLTRTNNFELLMEMMGKAINECYEDEANTIKIEITEEGFIDILQGQQEQVSRNGKCLRYCILKSHNLFTPNNTLSDKDVVMFFENLFVTKDVNVDFIHQIIEKCDETIKHEADRCELAHQASICILKQLKAFELIN